MARNRTLKPEICASAQFAECSTNARLTFCLMILFCDDGGRHTANARRLKMEIFPGDCFTEKEVAALVEELKNAKDESGVGLVTEYSINGCVYWEVTGWDKHQRVEKPYYKYPTLAGIVPDSWNVRRTFDERSPRNGTERNGTETESPTETLRDETGRDETAICKIDWGKVRADARKFNGLVSADKPQDRNLVLKACALAQGAIPEAWLWEAHESLKVNHPKKPAAYLTKCLKSLAEEHGRDFRQMLARIKLPREIFAKEHKAP